MTPLVIGISIVVALAVAATVAGVVYTLLRDPDRTWAK